MFIRTCVILISCSLAVISSQNIENPRDSVVRFQLVKNVCPDRNSIIKTSDFLHHDQAAFNGTIHCIADEQCKIGSKCCPVDELHSSCVDLIDMTLTKSQLLPAASFQRNGRNRNPKIFSWKIFSLINSKSPPCTQKCRTDDDCFEFKGGGRKAVYNCVYTSYYPYKCAHCQYGFSFPPGGQSFTIPIRP